ncbi:hypothetical protein MRB53_034059 [Persea americana]|uniref:Uncharacterized protein n=1 Tax=Persea americana TaxID=3435 RepID=A0ACC2KXM0_PERAE|nr:hypothetical protein MRB53_034059 [Persea americana]
MVQIILTSVPNSMILIAYGKPSCTSARAHWLGFNPNDLKEGPTQDQRPKPCHPSRKRLKAANPISSPWRKHGSSLPIRLLVPVKNVATTAPCSLSINRKEGGQKRRNLCSLLRFNPKKSIFSNPQNPSIQSEPYVISPVHQAFLGNTSKTSYKNISLTFRFCIENGKRSQRPTWTRISSIQDWEDATCSVCMEFPHNAVLLLCSSHDKGCRPYMCGTSYRYSNCLNQFKKASTKVLSPRHGQALGQDAWRGSVENPSYDTGSAWPSGKQEVTELACPLCRGQVKGWTVVEAAREYLNAKKRSCMQDQCSFVGTYKELRKHVRVEHPSARPREVDPALEQKWRNLEWERERDDVLSTIMSSTPGAMVLGDYVIEGGLHHHHLHHHHHDFDTDDDDDNEMDEEVDSETGIGDPDFYRVFSLLGAFMSGGDVSFRSRLRRLQRGFRTLEEGGGSGVPPIVAGAAASAAPGGDNEFPALGARVVGLGRSQRRHRRRSRRER